ncbi:HAD family hydrolase [Asanoa sp. WMMD1127]|uniref:HAD family hydrolase n=1 Tax=Asanoa sp. WMMD1127 TaxID=3016107 RepID=UPI0024164CFA|nr:HAD family hydrolase [Asanoa sp. WMMD1127]MDG4822101.1 HAD family hydrolase [Asanoa sp. WMMD1127]
MMLIATDLDGTLLRADKTISARTSAALERAAAADLPVVLVTGRPIRWLKLVYEQLATPLPAVCANGAVVYDPHRDQVLRANPMAPEALAEIARRLADEVPEAVLAVEIMDGREMRHHIDYPMQWDTPHGGVEAVEAVAELLREPAVKLLVRAGERDPDEFTARVGKALAGVAEATHSSTSGLVEVSASGVTKAAGLAWYCARLGVPAADVTAFGDMPNDVPMLAWAGRAIAVGNAHPAVKEIADEVVATNEDDGVATYLEKVLA